jgi:hypothetical protein
MLHSPLDYTISTTYCATTIPTFVDERPNFMANTFCYTSFKKTNPITTIGDSTSTKGVHVHQVISLDFE